MIDDCCRRLYGACVENAFAWFVVALGVTLVLAALVLAPDPTDRK